MKRNTEDLGSREFDVLVVGGGVYGAASVRDAALRGLSVAIIDARDFCGATSANSLKIIHGGLRYLQQLDVVRVLESVRERKSMMRIASHLVHPMPCIMPTRGCALKSRPAMAAGLMLNEVLSYGRNRDQDPEKYVPAGRIVSASECLRIVSGLGSSNVTGGAIWFDALAHNTERLVISMIRSAVKMGATAANYVRMTGYINKGNRVHGVMARDMLTGGDLEIRAKVVINNTGPWVNETLDMLDARTTKPLAGLSLGVNLVLNRQLFPKFAVGLSCPGGTGAGDRLLFFVPWKSRTMVGTYYRSHEGGPDSLSVTNEDMDSFLADLNRAYPAGKITGSDVAMVHAGVLPTRFWDKGGVRDPLLARHYTIVDHEKLDDIHGLVSVLGVKYTTARDVAVKTMDLVSRKLGSASKAIASPGTPVMGADTRDFNGLLAQAELQDAAPEVIFNYGTEYKDIIDRCESPKDTVAGEMEFIIENEMPQTLSDVLFRRSDLGLESSADKGLVLRCAEIMGARMGWDRDRMEDEVRKTRAVHFPGSEWGRLEGIHPSPKAMEDK